MANPQLQVFGNPQVQDERREIEIFSDIVANIMSARQEALRRLGGQQKDLYDECSYEETTQLGIRDYQDQYDRNPIANRVVRIFPKESWQVFPSVWEAEDASVTTPFEKALEEVGKSLAESNFYQASEPSEGNPLWDCLEKADEACGLGSFGGVLLGFDDGRELSQPLSRKLKRNKLLFMRPLDQTVISVAELEKDPTSSRFGAPKMYEVSLMDSQGVGTGKQYKVHWHRLVHLADNTTNNPWIGVPRMRPVWNRLKDLDKLYGGSAEMYWRGAFPGLAIETNPQLGGDVEIDQLAVREAVQNYMTKLQRYLALTGMTAKSLAPQVVDPSPQIDRQLDAICIQLDCPKRIFIGSERGELASTQDDKLWNDRVRYRQNNFVSPKVIVPVLNRLIMAKVLPTPKKFSVVWPDLDSLTDTEKADIAIKKTQALSQFVSDDVESIFPLTEFLTYILKERRGDVMSVVAAAEKLKKNQKDRLTTSKLELEKQTQARAKKAQMKQETNPITRVKQQATKGRLKSSQPRNLTK